MLSFTILFAILVCCCLSSIAECNKIIIVQNNNPVQSGEKNTSSKPLFDTKNTEILLLNDDWYDVDSFYINNYIDSTSTDFTITTNGKENNEISKNQHIDQEEDGFYNLFSDLNDSFMGSYWDIPDGQKLYFSDENFKIQSNDDFDINYLNSAKDYDSIEEIKTTELLSEEANHKLNRDREFLARNKTENKRCLENEMNHTESLKRYKTLNTQESKSTKNNNTLVNIKSKLCSTTVSNFFESNPEVCTSVIHENLINIRKRFIDDEKTNNSHESEQRVGSSDTQMNKDFFEYSQHSILNEKIIKNIKIIENRSLDLETNLKKEIVHDEILLGKNKKLTQEILQLEENYISKISKKENFESTPYKTDLNKDRVYFQSVYDQIFVEISDYIKSYRIVSLIDIPEVTKNLNIRFNKSFNNFFDKETNKMRIKNCSADVYWEFLKIYVDISMVPLFNVILPEFVIFNLKKNINYFKIVDKLDITNILKMQIVLNTYNFLFNRLKDSKNPKLLKFVSVFVFHSRFYLRRYLICYLSSIWESNLFKLYVKITCNSHNIKTYHKEYLDVYNQRHENICSNKNYVLLKHEIDYKENIMRLFFQIDLTRFRYFLNLKVKNIKYKVKNKNKIKNKNKKLNHCHKKNDKYDTNCFFKSYLFTDDKHLNFSGIFNNRNNVYDFMKYYLQTLRLYMYKNEYLVNKTLRRNHNPKIDRFKNDFDRLKNLYKASRSSTNKFFDDMLIKKFKEDDSYFIEYIGFWVRFEDESIRSLVS